jgi:tRNA-2-methylthio-N6-dimethylallyladenosine synthase
MFQYSQRPGTPAATMEGQLPKEVVQERFERLLALQERISGEESRAQVGRTLEVLVAEGAGRKDGATHRLSGRARDNRLVHFALPGAIGADDDGPGGRNTSANLPSEPAGLDDPRLADAADLAPDLPRPGDIVTVTVTHAAPHHLIADSAVDGATDGGSAGFSVRRTRSGDAWAAREKARLGGGDDHHGHGAPAPDGPVALGMPTLGRR